MIAPASTAASTASAKAVRCSGVARSVQVLSNRTLRRDEAIRAMKYAGSNVLSSRPLVNWVGSAVTGALSRSSAAGSSGEPR